MLAAVQQLIIPIQCEYYGLEGISQLLNTVRLVQQNINPGLAIGGVLLTMYDSRLNLCRQVAEDATEYFGPKVFAMPIPRNVRLAEAPSFGKPILLYDVQSVGAKSYLAVAQELLRRVEGTEVTIAPAQVAAATAHAAAAAAVVAQPEEPASAEGESGEAVAAEAEPTSQEHAAEEPGLGGSDSPVAMSSSVEEETPAEPRGRHPCGGAGGAGDRWLSPASRKSYPRATSPSKVCRKWNHFLNRSSGGGAGGWLARFGSGDLRAGQRRGSSQRHGSSAVERGDDEANRQPHQSSESKPEVTT